MTRTSTPQGIKQYQEIVRQVWQDYRRDTRDTSGTIAYDIFRTENKETLKQQGKDKVMTDPSGKLQLPPRAISFETSNIYFTPGVLLTYPNRGMGYDALAGEVAELILTCQGSVPRVLDFGGNKYFLLQNTNSFFKTKNLSKNSQRELEKFLRFATAAESHFRDSSFWRSIESLEEITNCMARDHLQRIQEQLAEGGESK